jgi:hypothetical protein
MLLGSRVLVHSGFLQTYTVSGISERIFEFISSEILAKAGRTSRDYKCLVTGERRRQTDRGAARQADRRGETWIRGQSATCGWFNRPQNAYLWLHADVWKKFQYSAGVNARRRDRQGHHMQTCMGFCRHGNLSLIHWPQEPRNTLCTLVGGNLQGGTPARVI